MKTIVCMKQVPDSESKIRLTPDKSAVERGDFSYVVNPYDEYAIEEAIKLKEAAGSGEVVLLSLGHAGTRTTLQKGMAMGADRSVLLDAGEDYTGDAFTTATLLARQLKEMEYDLIFFGKQAIDDDDSQVGAMVGEILGLPTVTAITALTISDGKAVVKREAEGGAETYEVTLPAVFTAEKGLNEPRYPSLKGIMQARKKPVEVIQVTPEAATTRRVEYSYPPARGEGKIVGKGVDAVPELVRLLREEAKVI